MANDVVLQTMRLLGYVGIVCRKWARGRSSSGVQNLPLLGSHNLPPWNLTSGTRYISDLRPCILGSTWLPFVERKTILFRYHRGTGSNCTLLAFLKIRASSCAF